MIVRGRMRAGSVGLAGVQSNANAGEAVFFRMTPNEPDSVANDTYGFASKFSLIPSGFVEATWEYTDLPTGNYDGTGCVRLTAYAGFEQYNWGFAAPAISSPTFSLGDEVFIRLRIYYESTFRWQDQDYTFPANPVLWGQKLILFGNTAPAEQPDDQSRSILFMAAPGQDNSFCTLGGTNTSYDKPSDLGITGGSEDQWYDAAYVHRYGSLVLRKNIELNECVGPLLQTYAGNTPGPASGWYHVQYSVRSGLSNGARLRAWVNNNNVNSPDFTKDTFNLNVLGWNSATLYLGGYMDSKPNANMSFRLGGFEIGPTFDPNWSP